MGSILFAIDDFQIDVKTILIILGALLITIFFLYVIGKRIRFKGKVKQQSKKLKKKFASTAKNIETIMSEIDQTKKYNGSYNSLRGSTKSKIKKYLIKWIEKVPFYVSLNHKAKENKYRIVCIAVQDDLEARKNKSQWIYNPSAKSKKNLKSLLKMVNKFKVCKATLDVVSHIYEQESIKENFNQLYYSQENNLYVKYLTTKR